MSKKSKKKNIPLAFAPPNNYFIIVYLAAATAFLPINKPLTILGGFPKMASVNKVILIGNLGRDPELRYTPQGRPVANFSLATTERWTSKSGEKQERTEWHKIVLWGRQAEVANQYLKKGSPCYIEGRITTRSWEDKDKVKRYSTEIECTDMRLLGSRGDSPSSQQAPMQPDEYFDSFPETTAADSAPFGGGGQSGGSSGGSGGGGDDDLPF
jgi:single-strand DNA-binding protein